MRGVYRAGASTTKTRLHTTDIHAQPSNTLANLGQLPVQLLQLAQQLPLHVPLRVEQVALCVC